MAKKAFKRPCMAAPLLRPKPGFAASKAWFMSAAAQSQGLGPLAMSQLSKINHSLSVCAAPKPPV
jgi:hypothetical protein